LSSSVHVVNPWYVKTLEVSVSLHIIDCSTTLTLGPIHASGSSHQGIGIFSSVSRISSCGS
jgi:hypothetical protein